MDSYTHLVRKAIQGDYVRTLLDHKSASLAAIAGSICDDNLHVRFEAFLAFVFYNGNLLQQVVPQYLTEVLLSCQVQ